MPTIDFTVTISVILALCALFAPSITAIINNHHQYKIRKMELEQKAYKHRSNVLYQNKYEIYKEFISEASDYSMFNDYARNFTKVIACTQAALLVCNEETHPLLLKFQTGVLNHSSKDREEYVRLLSGISDLFNQELTALSSTHNEN